MRSVAIKQHVFLRIGLVADDDECPSSDDLGRLSVFSLEALAHP